MLLQPDGDLQIARGEVVTVTVTANNTHYLAIFSDLQQANWTIVQPIHPIGPVRFATGRWAASWTSR